VAEVISDGFLNAEQVVTPGIYVDSVVVVGPAQPRKAG
jgi:hypothetical protein